MKNILIVIDDIEFKYFEFNKLVTNFWFVFEYLRRENKVYITLKNKLFQRRNIPYALVFETHIENNDIIKEQSPKIKCLNDFDTIFFRPDPPVDIDYINASYVLSYINKDVFIVNSPSAIRNINEKLYVNEFQDFIPDNIVSADEKIIKEFLFEKKEIIIKPLNRCFGSGVFYLNDKDKNINAILSNATNNYKTQVMVQEFIPKVSQGDKRLIYICGEIFEYCVRKIASNNDFKFNEHNSNTLKPAELTQKEKSMQEVLKNKFEKDGIYTAGLDVIDEKIIEINITSPCFFIKEINEFYNIQFEKIITDKIEDYSNKRKSTLLASQKYFVRN